MTNSIYIILIKSMTDQKKYDKWKKAQQHFYKKHQFLVENQLQAFLDWYDKNIKK